MSAPSFLAASQKASNLISRLHDFPVAEYVRIRRASLGIFVEHVVDHALAVLLAQVHEIEGDTDLAGDQFGDEPVFFPFAVAVQGGIGVVPVLHEHGKDIIALLLEQPGRYTGVHASGKSDANLHKEKRESLAHRTATTSYPCTSHRYDLLPLLPSGPGGVQRELVVYDFPDAKVRYFSGFAKII